MSYSIKKQTNMQRKQQLKLKPYVFDNSNFKHHSMNECLEFYDLKDCRNAAIKELVIKSSISLPDLTELLSNKNVKKITLNIDNEFVNNVNLLMLVAKLLRKNLSIKEIELNLSYHEEKEYNSIFKMALTFFFETISKRLLKINDHSFSQNNIHIYKLLYSNSNVVEINFDYEKQINKEYRTILEYILTTNMNLDAFKIDETCIRDFDKQFFISIRQTKANAEINTLFLDNIKASEECIFFIDNAYLFNVETLKIRYILDEKMIMDQILKLCNNPLNTVKRIIIMNDDFNIINIISDLLNSNEYDDVLKIPKIFIHEYKEVKIEHITNSDYDTNNKGIAFKVEYFNSIYNLNFGRFVLNFNSNSFNCLDKNEYFNLLNTIFNCPEKIEELIINLDSTLKNQSPEYIQKYVESLVNLMKEIFYEFKSNHIYCKNMKIPLLTFNFRLGYPEFNIFFFTILNIFVDLKIKIDKLLLKYCSITELANFMNNHKALESLNIKNIIFDFSEIDIKDIDILYQYSHLIEEKICLRFCHKEANLKTSNEIIESLYTYFYSKSIEDNANFIYFCNFTYFGHFTKRFTCACIHAENYFDSKDDVNKYIQNIQNEHKIRGEKNFTLKDIHNIDMEFNYYLNQEAFYDLFSLLKRHQYYIRNTHISKIEELKTDHARKILSIYLETILSYKSREKESPKFQCNLIFDYSQIDKKRQKYFKLHNIIVFKNMK